MAKEHASSRAKSGMGGKKSGKKSGKHPHEIRIRHGKSGGHIVTHHFQPDESGQMPEPEEHVMPDQASLLQHVADNTPPDPNAGAAGPGPGAGAPPPDQGAGAGPQPGM